MAANDKRPEIELPATLLDDPLGQAQHAVSVPDVVLLVDGDPVAELGWEQLTLSKRRDALVTYLADLSRTCGASPDVVFDGRVGDGAKLPASRQVAIRLTTPPHEPTTALGELIESYPKQRPIVLVTDSELAVSAADRGVMVLSNNQLLDLLIAGRGPGAKGGSDGSRRRAGAVGRLRTKLTRGHRRADESGF